jgi:hypothetical protein
VKKWLKTGSFGEQNGEGMPIRDRPSSPGGEVAAGKEEEDSKQKTDRGREEIDQGHEPCFKCGGKVVWKMGEKWFLECEGCRWTQ